MNRNMNRNIEIITPMINTYSRVNYRFVQYNLPIMNLMNNSNQLFDPDLDEAIRRSLED